MAAWLGCFRSCFVKVSSPHSGLALSSLHTRVFVVGLGVECRSAVLAMHSWFFACVCRFCCSNAVPMRDCVVEWGFESFKP
jgi:hypothetical protein